jgi:hypothetical protein
LSDGSRVNGQVIGVYNERPFMWHPLDQDTIALFKCEAPELGLDSFKTSHSGDSNAVFTINTNEILAIQVDRPVSYMSIRGGGGGERSPLLFF